MAFSFRLLNKDLFYKISLSGDNLVHTFNFACESSTLEPYMLLVTCVYIVYYEIFLLVTFKSWKKSKNLVICRWSVFSCAMF